MTGFFESNEVLVQATLIGLVLALSVQVPLRMGVFSFAGAGSYGIGAYGCALLVIHQEMSAPMAIAVTMLITAAVGFVLGVMIYRLNGLYLAMATVAFDLIIGVIALNGGERTGSSTGLYGVITDFGTSSMFLLAGVVLACVIISELGRTGRRVQAVRDDPDLAGAAGINVRRYRITAFVISGALGGLAGAMNVLIRTTIGPLDIGFGLIVLALTMIIVGGAMSWKGAVIGAIIFTWLPDILTVIGEWQELIYGIIVALAAIFLPRGIHGLGVDALRWAQRRRRVVDTSADAPPDELPVEAMDGDGGPTRGSERPVGTSTTASVEA